MVYLRAVQKPRIAIVTVRMLRSGFLGNEILTLPSRACRVHGLVSHQSFEASAQRPLFHALKGFSFQ